MRREALERATVVVDARWLGMGGAGKATELLLRGLRDLQPAGTWLVWGTETARAFLWGSAGWRPAHAAPAALWGQRDALRVPRCDVVIHLHQIRPLRPGPSVTLIHDTIPLRYRSRAVRPIKKAFLRMSARVSSRVLTVSEYSRQCIEADLRVPSAKIRVVRYPVDRAMAARVGELRTRLAPSDVGLYVGRFAPHKNLRALIEAFARTDFRRRGGRLLLAGGAPHEVTDFRNFVTSGRHEQVSVEGPWSQAALEKAYATSRFLVMPSLEEGFGLPVWEAMACGLPVCVSDGGALPEITRDVAMPFPARSVEAMAKAIDDAADQSVGPPAVLEAPTIQRFAEAFVEEAERVVTGA